MQHVYVSFLLLLLSTNSFNSSSCSCRTIFAEAGLKIWQRRPSCFPVLFSVAVLFCTIGDFWVVNFLTSFLKLKGFSTTFLCPALTTTVPAGELVIPGLVAGCVYRYTSSLPRHSGDSK